jgi:hypothetical protein
MRNKNEYGKISNIELLSLIFMLFSNKGILVVSIGFILCREKVESTYRRAVSILEGSA